MTEPTSRETEIITVDPAAPEASAIARAATVLRSGGLVAFPTETVYGLGADALSPAAVRSIFSAKERPTHNPLIVHVPDAGAARGLVAEWPELAARAAAAFWPGPLTLVLPKTSFVPAEVTAGLDTVGVRVPSHPVALALLHAAQTPVAAPSANLFTRVSATTGDHVTRALTGRVDVILDGGATPLGIESTVLDVSSDKPVLLRPGIIGLDELEAVLGPVTVAPQPVDEIAGLRSPGQLARHYSPRARIVLYTNAEEGVKRSEEAGPEQRVGAVVRNSFTGRVDEVLVLPQDPAGYARLLYASLHALDDDGCDIILIEEPPRDKSWDAVRDRLRRAAR
jgi:L-threonylcarbamoyladenylate synthase